MGPYSGCEKHTDCNEAGKDCQRRFVHVRQRRNNFSSPVKFWVNVTGEETAHEPTGTRDPSQAVR